MILPPQRLSLCRSACFTKRHVTRSLARYMRGWCSGSGHCRERRFSTSSVMPRAPLLCWAFRHRCSQHVSFYWTWPEPKNTAVVQSSPVMRCKRNRNPHMHGNQIPVSNAVSRSDRQQSHKFYYLSCATSISATIDTVGTVVATNAVATGPITGMGNTRDRDRVA